MLVGIAVLATVVMLKVGHVACSWLARLPCNSLTHSSSLTHQADPHVVRYGGKLYGGAGKSRPQSKRDSSPRQFFPSNRASRSHRQAFDWSRVEEGDHVSFFYRNPDGSARGKP